MVKTPKTWPLTYTNRQFLLLLQEDHTSVALAIVGQISEINGPGCLKSGKQLIFDPILCYHNAYEEEVTPESSRIGF